MRPTIAAALIAFLLSCSGGLAGPLRPEGAYRATDGSRAELHIRYPRHGETNQARTRRFGLTLEIAINDACSGGRAVQHEVRGSALDVHIIRSDTSGGPEVCLDAITYNTFVVDISELRPGPYHVRVFYVYGGLLAWTPTVAVPG